MPRSVEHALGDRAVVVGALDRLRAAVAEHHAVAGGELVALGVSAEVVVIVEDEDARLVAGLLAIEIGRRQSADAASDDDEVVALGGFGRLGGGVPESVIAQRVCILVRRVVTAAQSGESGGIVTGTGGIFGREVVERGEQGRVRGEQRAPDTEADAVQEVATRDVAVHAEVTVVAAMAHACLRKLSRRESPDARCLRDLPEDFA